MKLLVYGGCHALVMKRLIQNLGPKDRHEVDLIVNFELIRSEQPFPYEKLDRYDAVVYSPIENKAHYNTAHLDRACRDAGVQAVRFPWLEWHGYAPGADKGIFLGHVSWYFPSLVTMSDDFGTLRDFCAAALAEYPSTPEIERIVLASTQKVREQETRVGCEIRVSDFILDRYRDAKMFLIPDHPALPVYRFVIEELERLLGARLIGSWPADLPDPQPEARTPIFPQVERVLGLGFSDRTWRCDSRPLRSLTLESYIAQHFELGRLRRGAADGKPGQAKLATA